MALLFAFLAAAPLLSMRRHMYHAPTDRYGLHRSHSAAISSGFGSAGSPYSSCTPLRTPRSPDGSTSGRCSEKIMNMWTVHSPTPFTLVSSARSAASSIAATADSESSPAANLPARSWR
uniref:Secreted protein n=1 Tax=Oryza nivara TaxID=4536 RepID=A0A0E0HIK8_ORYNI